MSDWHQRAMDREQIVKGIWDALLDLPQYEGELSDYDEQLLEEARYKIETILTRRRTPYLRRVATE